MSKFVCGVVVCFGGKDLVVKSGGFFVLVLILIFLGIEVIFFFGKGENEGLRWE